MLVFVISCNSTFKEIRCIEDTHVIISLERFGKKSVTQYLYAYGLGKDTQKINYVEVDRYNSGYDDTMFMLPINLNNDTSIFCLIRKDMSIDTFGITYKRKFRVHRPCGYLIELQNLKAISLSENFYKDSVSYKNDNRNYLYRNEIHFKLRK